MKVIKGGITSPKGFSASGIHCGIKFKNKDLALIYSEKPALACGVFTQNRVKAAPLIVTRKHLQNKQAQAIVINSGNANCCTGKQGITDALATCSQVAQKLGISKTSVLVASTGIIGRRLPVLKIKQKIPALVEALNKKAGAQAARAILTTDTRLKTLAVKIHIGKSQVKIGAMAKGAGMIHPNMATMLGFITTDAVINKIKLSQALKEAVVNSFNLITVEGDTSTNDMVLALANGAASNRKMTKQDFLTFQKALNFVCLKLAQMIIKDAEGATKFVEIKVEQARDLTQAKRVAFGVANSPLVKTAIFGQNPNWGRVAAACGAADQGLLADRLMLYLGRIKVLAKGEAVKADAQKLHQAFKEKEILIRIILGLGKAQVKVYTCDLSDEYVKINAEY